MKKSKKLFVLLGVLAVVCVATVLLMRTEENKEQIKNSGEIILEVSSDDVTALSWEHGETSLAFHKDDTWVYDDDAAFPVDEDKIHDLLEQFEAFGVSFVIEEVSDFGMYGLDDPVCTINFATAEQEYEITLGDFSNMDSERYVSIGNGNVYLAKVDPLDKFDAVLKDMILHDEDLSYDKISQITFEGTKDYSVFYEEESTATYCADDVYFTQRGGKTLPLDTGRVGDYLENLTTLNPTNYVTYNATEEELETYGMTDPELTVTVDYTDQDDEGKDVSDTFVLHVSRNPEDVAAAEAAAEEDPDAEEEDIPAYVRIGGSQIIYEITSDRYGELMAASYNDLRHLEVLSADFIDVTQLDFTLEGNSHTLIAGEDIEETDEGDESRLWTYLEEEIEIDDLQSELEELRASSSLDFTDEKPDGKSEISVTVHLANENHPKVEIELYRYDGEDCLAVVDGESFALIPRGDVVDLIEAVNAIVLN